MEGTTPPNEQENYESIIIENWESERWGKAVLTYEKVDEVFLTIMKFERDDTGGLEEISFKNDKFTIKDDPNVANYFNSIVSLVNQVLTYSIHIEAKGREVQEYILNALHSQGFRVSSSEFDSNLPE